MNETLLQFESETGLGPTYAARLLGVAYPTYAQYRSERRELPVYHQHHIEALLMLPQTSLGKLIKEHANGNRR